MKHPAWIEEYIAALHNAFKGMVPSRWGSADIFKLLPTVNGAFIEKVHEAVTKLKEQKVSPTSVKDLFSNPSTLRVAVFFLVTEYQLSDHVKKEQTRETLEYLTNVLVAMTPDDLFAFSTNRTQSPKEVRKTVQDLKFTNGTPEAARELGKLFNSASALAFALYRDMFPQEANEAYGPYEVSEVFGSGTTLVVKDFSKMYIPDVWPQGGKVFGRLQIFQAFRGVDFSCEWIGMHSRYSGDVIHGLHAYAVVKDGEQVTSLDEIKELRHILEHAAVEQFKVYDDFSNQDWVHQLLVWDCYQFNKFFEKAGMDWRPTQKMLDNTKNVVLPIGFAMESFPATVEEYKQNPDYDAYWLLEMYR